MWKRNPLKSDEGGQALAANRLIGSWEFCGGTKCQSLRWTLSTGRVEFFQMMNTTFYQVTHFPWRIPVLQLTNWAFSSNSTNWPKMHLLKVKYIYRLGIYVIRCIWNKGINKHQSVFQKCHHCNALQCIVSLSTMNPSTFITSSLDFNSLQTMIVHQSFQKTTTKELRVIEHYSGIWFCAQCINLWFRMNIVVSI